MHFFVVLQMLKLDSENWKTKIGRTDFGSMSLKVDRVINDVKMTINREF
jgi:hypothetical protein